MQAARAGHSRKESDDFPKLFFDDGSHNFEADGENFPLDPVLEPSLLFHQPKSSYTFVSTYAWLRTFSFLRWLFKLYVHPAGALSVLVVAVVIPVVLGWTVFHNDYKERGELLVIDKSLESFEIPGHISSEHEDMVYVASKLSKESTTIPLRVSKQKRSANMPDIFPTTKPPHQFQKYPKWTLELVYLATGNDASDLNIFTKDRLETIHQIEQSLMQQKSFSDFCWQWTEARKDPFLPNGCTPPISLIDFFYPSVIGELRVYDGQGMGFGPNGGKRNLTDESIDQSLRLLLTKPFTYWFVDGSFSSGNRKSRFLRAEMKFGYPLKYSKYGHSKYHQNKAFKAFLVKYVEAVKKMSTDNVRVLYGGSDIFDYEVNKTLWEDIGLSVFTIAFVGAFVLVFTRFSIFLTVCGIVSILTPICLAYYLFRVVFHVQSLGILSGISVFIIIGIGVDDVFVFINIFRQAHSAKTLESRMVHTLATAGKATFFTSFTTSAAFAANCLSQMPAIHDFGLFMALIVSSCWLTVFCTLPPALNLWHRYISKWEERAFQVFCRRLSCASGSGSSFLPDDIVQFLSGNGHNRLQDQPTLTEEMELSSRAPVNPQDDDDDDSMLLQLSNSPSSQSPSPSTSDTDLAMFDDVNSTFEQQMTPLVQHTSTQPRARNHREDQHSKACVCGGGLQAFLYHWLGVPIQKYPIVVLIGFLLILGASIALDTQIQPSTKPPAFFKESTNLQQLLYLKYNMSSDKLDVKGLADELKGVSVKQSNNVDNPATEPTTKPKETNGVKSSTPIPTRATAVAPGPQPKTNIQQKTSKHPSSKPTSLPKKTSTPSARKSSSETSTKSIKKPTTRQKEGAVKTQAKRKEPVTQQPMAVVSGENVYSHSAFNTPPPPCPGGCTPIEKPFVDSSATVYVIFGLKAIDRSKIVRERVIEKKGDVVPDYDFTDLVTNEWNKFLMYACKLCKKLSSNAELVQPGGADCFPRWILEYIHSEQYRHDSWNKDCLKLKSPSFSIGQSRAKLMKMPSKSAVHGNYTYWMKMAFESTAFMGKSSKERVIDFDNWNKFLKDEVRTYPKGLQTTFQTCSEWVLTFTEVIAINSAIYGIAFSLVLCLGSVAVFTANILLTLIVMVTILGVLSSVVAIFYLASWQLGAVEAISLSILVGTSVDYCVHLVEGYIMAGNSLPNLSSSKEIRGWRSLAAVSHIGTAILSSAITTVVASIPLCLTTIQLFAKFGQILAINTAVSIFFTLSICVALLCMMSPARFRASFKTSIIAFVTMAVVYSVGAGILYVVNWKAVTIPGPAGEPLFSKP